MEMEEITPEMLREMAAKIERGDDKVLDIERGDIKAVAEKPYIRHVGIDGASVDIDMRRVRDYRAMSLIAKVEAGDSFAAISLFEFLLGDQKDSAIEQLSDADGFCDAERFVQFCGKLLNEVGAKN